MVVSNGKDHGSCVVTAVTRDFLFAPLVLGFLCCVFAFCVFPASIQCPHDSWPQHAAAEWHEREELWSLLRPSPAKCLWQGPLPVSLLMCSCTLTQDS